MWEETSVPRENTRKHEENMQTPQRKTLVNMGGWTRCEIPQLTHSATVPPSSKL